jgi:class 3 adenylate cyclase/tetratricopeptide (TPR) repeat protein
VRCGAALATCERCGADLPQGVTFCPACGNRVSEALPVGEERKLVTVLFADVAGSTGLGERLDPEQLKEVLDAFLHAMRVELEAEGGTVEKFIGDAVMAVFGVPTAHEDDPTRALRAALRMRRALERLNDVLEERHGIRLAIRIGVNTGDVVARTSPRLGEGFVTGDAVNVAARLEQQAGSGQILISERTARAARGLTLEDVGPLLLRGKEEATRTYVVLDEVVAEPGALRSAATGPYRTKMVGRLRELDVLRSVFERSVSERRPHLATVYGEAGVGKSRLVEEFVSWTAEVAEPPLVLTGRCLPYGEGVTYWPLAEILKGHAGVLDSDPPERALDRIHRAIADLLADVPGMLDAEPGRTAAALAFTVGLQDPAWLTAQDPREARAATQEAWRIYFSSLAGRSAVVAVVEDIHWADPALLELLEDLAEHSEGPLLFVCPARPELAARHPEWGGGRWNYSSLLLEPLSTIEAAEMLDLLVDEELSSSLRSRILESAGGNPFFLEEIVQRLIDERASVNTGAGPATATTIEDVDIPDTVQGVLAARMDLLPAFEKRVLQLASVVGRTFWNGAAASLLEPDPSATELDAALSRLERRGLVHARIGSMIVGEREYSFRHVLTQEVAYESLPRRDRARAHARVADWIERNTNEREREFAELLAHHSIQAHRGVAALGEDQAESERLRRRAFRYSMLAADEARGKLALQQAERFADEALSIAAGPIERSDALAALGMTSFHDYQGDLAWERLKEAIDLRVDLQDGSDDGRSPTVAGLCATALEVVTRARGTMRHRVSREEGEHYLEVGLIAAGPGDSEERVRLLVARSFAPFAYSGSEPQGGEMEIALRTGEEAAAMAERLGRVDLQSAALDGITSAHQSLGRYGAMEEAVRRRLDLAPKLADPYEVGDIHAMAAWWALDTGRYRESVDLADKGVHEAMSGSPTQGLYCLDFRAAARFRLGDWDGTLADVAFAEELLGERRETPPGFAPMHLAIAAFIHDARGDTGSANSYLHLVKWLEKTEERLDPVLTLWQARLLARRSMFDEARALLERPAVADDKRGRDEVLEAWCELISEQGTWDEADEVVDRSRMHASWAGVPPLDLYAARLEGRAAAARGDTDRAASLLASVATGFAALEASWEAAVTKLDLAAALEQQEDAETAQVSAQDAFVVFEGLRSVREVTRARELLGRLGDPPPTPTA